MSTLNSIKISSAGKTVEEYIAQVESILVGGHYDYDQAELHRPELWATKQRIVLKISQAGKKFIFKKLINFNQPYKSFFEQEKNILQYLTGAEIPFGSNQMIEANDADSWFVATLADGDCLGDILKVSENFNDSLFEKLLETLKYFERAEVAKSVTLQTFHDIEKTLALLDRLRLSDFTELHRYLENLYRANISYALDPQNYIFSHGDFSPINILSDGGSLFVIDWESAGLRAKTFDAAYIAHRFWRGAKRDTEKVDRIRNIFASGEAKSNFDFWLDYWAIFDIYNFGRYLRGEKFKNSEVFDQETIATRQSQLLELISGRINSTSN